MGNIKDSGIASASSYLKDVGPLSKSVVARRNSPEKANHPENPLYLNESPVEMRQGSEISKTRPRKVRTSLGQSGDVRSSEGGSEISGVNAWRSPSSVSSAESRLLRLEEQLKEK